MRKAVFIDRDGVINREIVHGHLQDKKGRVIRGPLHPDHFELYPDVQEAFRMLRQAGFLTVVVSNQNNVAKGFLDENTLWEIDRKMRSLLEPHAVYYCVHHEDYTGACECKKPRKGLLRQAVREHGIAVEHSYMIGDKRIDMIFGEACKQCFYVDTRHEEDAHTHIRMLKSSLQEKVVIVPSLKSAADRIIGGL